MNILNNDTFDFDIGNDDSDICIDEKNKLKITMKLISSIATIWIILLEVVFAVLHLKVHFYMDIIQVILHQRNDKYNSTIY